MSGPNNSANTGGGAGNKSRNRRQGRRRKTKKKPQLDAVSFWGDPARLPEGESTVRITNDPGAVVRSLGRPPLSGHYSKAEFHFTAVYERAVGLASALAAAGDLIEPDELLNDSHPS